MKYITIILLLFSCYTFSQDHISLADGRSFDCKIHSQDSANFNVYLKNNPKVLVKFSKQRVDSLIWLSNVSEYTKYLEEKGYSKNKTKPKFIEGNYLYLDNTTVIKGNVIEYKQPFLGSPHFLVDGKKHSNNNVKFYQNDEGFFANVKTVKASYNSSFSRNIRKSRINLFEQTTYHYGTYTMHGAYGFGGGIGFIPPTSYTNYYYNKGYNDLKKVNFNNLSDDMSDDGAALALLYKYEKERKNGNIFLGASLGAVAVGLVSFISKVSIQENPHAKAEFALVLSGTLCTWIKFLVWDKSKNPENLKRAIDAYNR